MKLKEKILSNKPESYWISSTEETNYPSLNDDINVDVIIVGGGIAGITAGYFLKEKGIKVAILESDKIVMGTTAHTTAKITSQHSLIYNKIKNNMGKEKAHQYAHANEFAIQTIAQLINEKNIDCEYSQQPAYVYTCSDEYVEKIEKEIKTASELGIKASYEKEIPLPINIKAAMKFNNQAQFHPRKFLLELAKEIPGDGSYIFENTKATKIKENKLLEVETENNHVVRGEKVIVASHYPFVDKQRFYFAKIYAERSYVVAAEIEEKFPKGMFINAEKPTRSLRSVPFDGKELVLFIGENHKTGHGKNMEKHYKALLDFAKNTFTLKDVHYRWSTQDCMTLDSVPYIGNYSSTSPNIYITTGYGKWGMTNSIVSAIILKDFITKGDNQWAPVFNPSRPTSLASAGKFVSVNAQVAEKLVEGKISPAPKDIDIKKGEGKVIKIKGQKIGAYKDDKGKLYLVDTTCTHLGCELNWNNAEKSWDCPCHGSRFNLKGEVIEGPAQKPLTRIYLDK